MAIGSGGAPTPPPPPLLQGLCYAYSHRVPVPAPPPPNLGCIPIKGTYNPDQLVNWVGTYSAEGVTYAGPLIVHHSYGVDPPSAPPDPARSAYANPLGTYSDPDCETPSSMGGVLVTGLAQSPQPDVNGVSVTCTYADDPDNRIQRATDGSWVVILHGTCVLTPAQGLPVTTRTMEIRSGKLYRCDPPLFPPDECNSAGDAYIAFNLQ